jgi:hypothetical protein
LWAGFIWLGGEGGEHENEGVITGRRYIWLSDYLLHSEQYCMELLCMCVCNVCMYVWRSETSNNNISHFFNTLQPNARCILPTYIFYQISLTCFSVLYTILRENFVYLLKTVSFVQDSYTRFVIKCKIYHSL